MTCRLAGVAGLFLMIAHAQNTAPLPTAEEIVARMETMSQQRDLSNPEFVCERSYSLDYHGFPEAKHAEMSVRSVQDGARKEFTVLSESGSAALRARVLHKMLDTEREASIGTLHEESRLARRNYDFSMVGTEAAQDELLYVLAVKPRVKSKVAWSGRVWLPKQNVSDTRVRFGGHAHLVIDYENCSSTANRPATLASH
jgi:hypothetical protein